MLNFADRTGYGALMVMWPYILLDVRTRIYKPDRKQRYFGMTGSAYFVESETM